ncbi:MAG: tetratricopeptide repeat protein [Deltaproteobacteria bacterium]|nr:tetratricopeptide repeat protein [Deltaproteobacteria bacterium]
MTGGRGPDRVWPILALLVAMIGGAAGLEALASHRAADAVVVTVGAAAVATAGDTDDPEVPDGPATEQPVLNEAHRHARTAARRGEWGTALPAFEALVSSRPGDGALRGEYGYWLLAADRPDEARAVLEQAVLLDGQDPAIALNLGVALHRSGDDAAAEREYRRALALDPGFAAARVALGSLLARTGRRAEAVPILESAAREGDNPSRARALAALGSIELAEGRREEAERFFDAAIARAPAQVEIRLRVGRSWLAAGAAADPARAVEVIQEAARLAPDVAEVHRALGWALERAARDAEARLAYDEALELDAGDTFSRRRLLRLALDRRDFALARLHAARLVDAAPDEPEHHFLAALVAARAGEWEDARAAYRDAIARMGGTYPEAYFNLGKLESDAGNPEAAIEAYRTATEQRPDYVEAWNNLGLVLARSGRTEESETSYRQAIAREDDYAPAWLNLGRLLSAADRHDEAILALRRAGELRPHYPEALLDLGVAYSRAGRVPDAIETYRRLLADEPRYARGWYNLGLALDESGRDAEAERAFREAMAVDPEHAASLRNLAELVDRAGRRGEALVLYQELLDRSPEDDAARLALAELRRRLGDSDGCVHDVRAVLAKAPDDAKALRLLERCAGAATSPDEGGGGA